MDELNNVIDPNEKVLWQGKPNFWPFFLSVGIISFLGLFVLIGSIFLSVYSPGEVNLFYLPHFWLAWGFFIIPATYQFLVYKHTYYAITNKRVIFQSGVIGRDFQYIDFDQITNAEVNIGIIDKLFSKSSGSIFVSSAGTFVNTKYGPAARPYTLSNINDPYEVFKFFKKVSHDVKTDINFPNKYRPSTNPGYNTKLKH